MFFEVTKVDFSSSVFLKIALAIQGLMWYNTNFKIFFVLYLQKMPLII